MIALRDAGYYKVGLLTRGSCRLAQEGREALLRPGDLAIYDCPRPYTMVFDEPHEMSFLMFPCDRLRLPPAAVEQVLVTCTGCSTTRARPWPGGCVSGGWPTAAATWRTRRWRSAGCRPSPVAGASRTRHFSKIFKASYGQPPGAYRQRADFASR